MATDLQRNIMWDKRSTLSTSEMSQRITVSSLSHPTAKKANSLPLSSAPQNISVPLSLIAQVHLMGQGFANRTGPPFIPTMQWPPQKADFSGLRAIWSTHLLSNSPRFGSKAWQPFPSLIQRAPIASVAESVGTSPLPFTSLLHLLYICISEIRELSYAELHSSGWSMELIGYSS